MGMYGDGLHPLPLLFHIVGISNTFTGFDICGDFDKRRFEATIFFPLSLFKACFRMSSN